MTALSPGRPLLVLLVIALVIIMACFVPYHVSLGGLPDNNSLAVAAGFDQHSAFLGICAVLAIASVIAALRPPVARLATIAQPIKGPGLNASFYAVTLLTLAVLVALLVNGDDRFNEIHYFTDRQALMIMGKAPYRDFLFDYGPILAWAPYVMHAIVGHWMLAYLLTDGLFLGLTLLLLRDLVRSLPVPPSSHGLIFVSLALFWVPMTYASGLHYSGLRFVLPVVLAFRMAHLRSAGLPRLIGWPLFASLLAFAFSFETGLVMLVLGGGILGFLALAERRAAPLLALAIYVGIAAAALSTLPDWLTMPLAANFAGREFPLVPNIFLVFFLASLAIAILAGVPPLLRAAVTGRLTIDTADLGLCFVAMLSLMLLPAAIGRADFIHIFSCGMGAVIVTACVAANAPRPLVVLAYCSIVVELVVATQILCLVPFANELRHGNLARMISGTPSAAATKNPDGLTVAHRHPGAYDPFLIAGPLHGIDTGYYTGFTDVTNDYATQRKLAELAAARLFLVPVGLRPEPTNAPEALVVAERQVYAWLAIWPFPIAIDTKGRPSPISQVVEVALQDCLPIDTVGHIHVCANRATAPARP